MQQEKPATSTLLFLSLSRLTKICMGASLRSTNRALTPKNVSLLHMWNTFSPVLDSAVSHYFRYIMFQSFNYVLFFFPNCFNFCIFKNIFMSLCSHVLDIKFASIIVDLLSIINIKIYNEVWTMLKQHAIYVYLPLSMPTIQFTVIDVSIR